MRITSIGVGGIVAVLATSAVVQAQVAGFKDVPVNHWAAQSVAALAQRGILQAGSGSGGAHTKSANPTTGAVYDGNKPVTRYELAVTLYRFVQYIEAADKQKKTKFGAEALPVNGPEALKRLIADGYLPASTPLAKEGTKSVTSNQFADALAEVLEKSREKTTPISPDLKGAPIEKPTS